MNLVWRKTEGDGEAALMVGGVNMPMHFLGQCLCDRKAEAGRMASAVHCIKTVKQMTGLNFVQTGGLIFELENAFRIEGDRKASIAVFDRITENI